MSASLMFDCIIKKTVYIIKNTEPIVSGIWEYNAIRMVSTSDVQCWIRLPVFAFAWYVYGNSWIWLYNRFRTFWITRSVAAFAVFICKNVNILRLIANARMRAAIMSSPFVPFAAAPNSATSRSRAVCVSGSLPNTESTVILIKPGCRAAAIWASSANISARKYKRRNPFKYEKSRTKFFTAFIITRASVVFYAPCSRIMHNL